MNFLKKAYAMIRRSLSLTDHSWSGDSSTSYSGEDVKLTTTYSDCIGVVDNGAVWIIGAMDFGSCVGAHLNAAGAGAQILKESGVPYTISGSATCHAYAQVNAEVHINDTSTISLTGTPNFSYSFAKAEYNSTINFGGNLTFAGAATGVRYTATGNAVVNTYGAGATRLPGNASGTLALGGQYI